MRGTHLNSAPERTKMKKKMRRLFKVVERRRVRRRKTAGVQMIHPLDSPAVAKNMDSIHIQTTTYTRAITASSGHFAGVGSVNLSSPESAYSTGYSTDGTSPGANFPPEYYINIRTGKHYFQDSKIAARTKRISDASRSSLIAPENARVEDKGETSSRKLTAINKQPRDLRTSAPNKCIEASTTYYPCQDQNHRSQQRPQQSRHQEILHQKAESFSVNSSINILSIPSSIPPPLIAGPLQSPRQRSRIRTNPWLSANSSNSSSTSEFKSRLTIDKTSNSSGLKLAESSGSVSDINISIIRTKKTRRECRHKSLSAGRSPVNQNWRITTGMKTRDMMISLAIQRRTKIGGRVSSSCSSSNSSISTTTRSIRSSDEDVTLNEMMGNFDESYVYDKETDILSDSDPTDRDDCIDSLSDIDTGQDGGDENDPFENDFDYIDNAASFLELEKMDALGRLPNKGHCKIFTMTNKLDRRGPRLSFSKIRSKDERANRLINMGSGAKRQSVRLKKMDKLPNEKPSNEKKNKRISQRRKCDNEPANLNRVLVETMLLKNSGFSQGSQSVGGTPICVRRKKHDLNKNFSPIKQPIDDRSLISPRQFLVEKRAAEILKRRSNSVNYVNGNLGRREMSGKSYMTSFASEIALIKADKEADIKYRELIMEAENILEKMQRKCNSSPVVPSPSRKFHNGLTNKRVELIKNTELNIELTLPQTKNSQPELQNGSIKDLKNISPKGHFPQRNGNASAGAFHSSAGLSKHNQETKCLDSSMMPRRASHDSLNKGLLQNRIRVANDNSSRNQISTSDYYGSEHASLYFNKRGQLTFFETSDRRSEIMSEACEMKKGNAGISNSPKAESLTSSSSESEERCEIVETEPLLNFRSIDMGPIKESAPYCPQSEPVKRKVYAGSVTFGRIQKTLGEHTATIRNSDGETTNEDTDDSRRSLREKVARLRQERLAAVANLNAQETCAFQQQLSQIRRQMLMQTIEDLKRSLEDQSATLKRLV